METMLKFRCDGCDKEFVVMDHQVDTDALGLPSLSGGDRGARDYMTKSSAGIGGALWFKKQRSTAAQRCGGYEPCRRCLWSFESNEVNVNVHGRERSPERGERTA